MDASWNSTSSTVAQVTRKAKGLLEYLRKSLRWIHLVKRWLPTNNHTIHWILSQDRILNISNPVKLVRQDERVQYQVFVKNKK